MSCEHMHKDEPENAVCEDCKTELKSCGKFIRFVINPYHPEEKTPYYCGDEIYGISPKDSIIQCRKCELSSLPLLSRLWRWFYGA